MMLASGEPLGFQSRLDRCGGRDDTFEWYEEAFSMALAFRKVVGTLVLALSWDGASFLYEY